MVLPQRFRTKIAWAIGGVWVVAMLGYTLSDDEPWDAHHVVEVKDHVVVQINDVEVRVDAVNDHLDRAIERVEERLEIVNERLDGRLDRVTDRLID